jgi:hypothetical protein
MLDKIYHQEPTILNSTDNKSSKFKAKKELQQTGRDNLWKQKNQSKSLRACILFSKVKVSHFDVFEHNAILF